MQYRKPGPMEQKIWITYIEVGIGMHAEAQALLQERTGKH